MPDLLIELFSEEIPARMQKRAAEDLRRLVTAGLGEAGLSHAAAAAFATPRRLVLTVEGLPAESPQRVEARKGPAVDAPDRAVTGFLSGLGVEADALPTLRKLADEEGGACDFGAVHISLGEAKGRRFFQAKSRIKGRPAATIVAEVLDKTIRDFPWPKSMRWGSGNLRWVRPLHRILCILNGDAGAEVVPLSIDGLTAGDITSGHRFMAPDPFRVTSFEDYAEKLRRARVMLDPVERLEAIRHDADQLAFARGLEIVPDEGLLAEIAGLVEWPVPLMGMIDAQFLTLPPEVLQTSMKEHQKFLSVRNPKTERIEGFVTVANIEAPDDGAAILTGNQRVLSARLADGAFFWEADLREARAGMKDWAEGLKSVTFHSKLGSQTDRVQRIAALAREIAPLVGADPDQAEDAARIAKLDLQSAMVGEFPELQGVMGRYYALEAGKPQAVADASRDHYAPLGPSDDVPTAPVSVAVALADKLDTLAGFWVINEKPTGSKDPYALRRAALGVIRLILENKVRLCLSALLTPAVLGSLDRAFSERASGTEEEWLAKWDRFKSEGEGVPERMLRNFKKFLVIDAAIERLRAAGYEELAAELNDSREMDFSAEYDEIDLLSFFHDRLKVHLREEGIRHDIIDSVLHMPGNDDLVLLVNRARALSDFLATDDGTNLLQGLKRAANILVQAEEQDGVEYSFGADPKFAETDEERALFEALDKADSAIAAAMKAEDFPAAMSAIAGLRAPIDAFFEAVQINTDNQVVRRNRLNLLHRIRAAGQGIADFSRIEG